MLREWGRSFLEEDHKKYMFWDIYHLPLIVTFNYDKTDMKHIARQESSLWSGDLLIQEAAALLSWKAFISSVDWLWLHGNNTPPPICVPVH